MKVYAKLEQFLTNLAYCCLVEDGFLEICEAAGIDWSWPKTFATEAVSEFLKFRGELGAEKAREKVRRSVGVLAESVHALSSLPTDLEMLRIEYRELSRVQRGIDAAHSILRDPEAFERILKGLEISGSVGVATVDHAQLVESYRLTKKEMQQKGAMVLIPGFELVSELIGGFDPGRITFLLAQSGFGKSNLAMALAYAATGRMAVAYMNLELTVEDLAKRMAVFRSKKSWAEHNRNKISIEEIEQSTRYEIRFSTGEELHVESIIAWAKGFKRTNPDFGLLVIDYDQKMEVQTSRDTPEWKALHLAVRELENLAKKEKIHVIMVAQFNRQGEIASSWRAINTAHSVLKFRPWNGAVVVENSIKSRHAKYPCAVYIDYDPAKGKVIERKPEGIVDFVEESPKEKSKETEDKFAKMLRGKT